MKKAVIVILVSLGLFCPVLGQLSAMPMKITVQTGDTIKFPITVKRWTATDAAAGATITAQPSHGTLTVIPRYYPQDPMARLADSTTLPLNLPGLQYIPQTGFTGRDQFTVTVSNSGQTSQAVYSVLITPPEPGGMTVLLVVNQNLLPQISAEVNRLKADLDAEGYVGKIKSFPNPASVTALADAKTLWDSLVAEYDRPDQFVAGAILIGRLPIGSGTNARGEIYWSMSHWTYTVEADTPYAGWRIGKPGNIVFYPRSFPNIWVTRMWALTGSGGALTYGTEADLIKRTLQANHDYRTGACRLPHKAYQFDLFYRKNLDYRKFLDIWPEAFKHPNKDSLSPFDYELKQGGEVWDLHCHGNSGKYNALDGKVWWDVYRDELMATHMPIRFMLISACHVADPGAITSHHVLPRNGGCVLAIGPSDYTAGAQSSLLDTSRFETNIRLRKYVAAGDRFGRSWLRSNCYLFKTTYYGDMSMKPKMAPANQAPVITGLSATRTTGLTWNLSVQATDADGNVAFYEWFPDGYDCGRGTPAAATGNSLSHTFSQAKVCTLRVEAVDNYKARDYLEVVLKTDSGLVSVADKISLDGGLRVGISVSPNPFSSAARISIPTGLIGNGEVLKADVFDAQGRWVRSLSAGGARALKVLHEIVWDGRDAKGDRAAVGLYHVSLKIGDKRYHKSLLLAK